MTIILIAVFIVMTVVLLVTPLKFADDNYMERYEAIRFACLPAAIVLTLLGTLKKTDSEAVKAIKIVITVGAAFVSVVVLYIGAFAGGMCGWSVDKVLFYNRKDKGTRIVIREFGCGATDGGPPIYNVSKITTIRPCFIWVTRADTTRLDASVWIPADGEVN